MAASLNNQQQKASKQLMQAIKESRKQAIRMEKENGKNRKKTILDALKRFEKARLSRDYDEEMQARANIGRVLGEILSTPHGVHAPANESKKVSIALKKLTKVRQRIRQKVRKTS